MIASAPLPTRVPELVLTHDRRMQIYFRKLGGATVDTPDLGPVKKLGMGRRTGPVVTPPRAASALPSFGDASLARRVRVGCG